MKPKIKSFIQGSLVVVVSIFVTSTIIKAGTITPPSETPVTAKFYTLSEIYTRLTTNATATEGGHDFTFSDSLASTHYTLTQIYDAIPTIAANTVKLGTTYLGVAGTLVPSGGDATTADVLANKTFFGDSQADWNLQTGTMANIGAQIIISSTTNLTITQGYHDGAGYCVGDTDLISTNILSGANIFGVAGDSNVVNTSSGDVANTDILSGKIAWVDGLEVTGNIANCSSEGGNTCYANTGLWTAFDKDGDNASIIQSAAGGINYFTALTGFYDEDDRVSATDSQVAALDADLATGNILSSATIFGLTGSIDNCSSEGSQSCYATGTYFAGTSKTPSNSTTSQSAGYYPAFDLVTDGDADLASANIRSTVEIFGVSGNSNVVNTSSGNAIAGDIASGAIAWVGGAEVTGSFDPWTPQWLQTKDDRVNFEGTAGEYTGEEASWETVSGSPFSTASTTLLSGTVKKDLRTGLWWSDRSNTTLSNSFTLTADGTRPTGGDSIAFCEALNTANFGGTNPGWYLPTQKELQQAYINGSANNLPSPGYHFWSSTEVSWDPAYAWRVYLRTGRTDLNTKVTDGSYYVRCVRR